MIRTLSSFKKTGIIDQEGKQMFLTDLDALIDLSGLQD